MLQYNVYSYSGTVKIFHEYLYYGNTHIKKNKSEYHITHKGNFPTMQNPTHSKNVLVSDFQGKFTTETPTY